MLNRFLLIITAMSVIIFTAGCAQTKDTLKDGYYTAEVAEFDAYGWKEFITVYISKGRIQTVEYDAFNDSGFVKSWDTGYMRTMKMACGTYPTEFSRIYGLSLINWQNPSNVDAVTGATDSHTTFIKLTEAVIKQAKAGDKQVALVY